MASAHELLHKATSMTPADHAATVPSALLAIAKRLDTPRHVAVELRALAERATEPKVFRLEREARLAAEARVTELERERDVVQRQFQKLALDEVERASLMKQRVKDAEQRAERAETALRQIAAGPSRAAWIARDALGETAEGSA